jgi:hypothetical protein
LQFNAVDEARVGESIVSVRGSIRLMAVCGIVYGEVAVVL